MCEIHELSTYQHPERGFLQLLRQSFNVDVSLKLTKLVVVLFFTQGKCKSKWSLETTCFLLGLPVVFVWPKKRLWFQSEESIRWWNRARSFCLSRTSVRNLLKIPLISHEGVKNEQEHLHRTTLSVACGMFESDLHLERLISSPTATYLILFVGKHKKTPPFSLCPA